jgi:hypothetical protein
MKLAEGDALFWSVGITALIGIVVALDVCGLVLSQRNDFRNQRLTPHKQALLHATAHGGLFLLYMAFVTLLMEGLGLVLLRIGEACKELGQAFTELWCNLTGWCFPIPAINMALLWESSLLLVGEITIVFVWWTYRNKLVENHTTKIHNKRNPLRHSRGDIRVIHYAVTNAPFLKGWFKKKPDRRLQYAMALAVAVDMLAISALIRVYFKYTPDSDTRTQAWHFSFFESLSQNEENPLSVFVAEVALFAAVVFVLVFLTALAAASWAKRMKTDQEPSGTLRFLRLSEPAFVFFFMTAALDHLLGVRWSHDTTMILPGMFENLPIKTVITLLFSFLLIWAVGGVENIFKAVEDGMNLELDKDSNSVTAPDSDDGQEEQAAAKTFSNWLVFSLMGLAFLTMFACAHEQNVTDPIPQFITYISVVFGLVSLTILFVPWLGKTRQRLGSWLLPDGPVDIAKTEEIGLPWFIQRRTIIGLGLTYLIVLIYGQQINFGTSGSVVSDAVRGNAYLGIFFFACLALLNLRVWYLLAKRTPLQAFGPSTAISEILNTVGAMTFLWLVLHQLTT